MKTHLDWPSSCKEIISRERWGGRMPVAVDYAIMPVKFAIIHHTVTPECNSEESCSKIMRSIQNFHMDTLEFHNVGYNFLVGGDGKIYEGSGWHKVGAHTRGYNSRSLGLAFIGDFSNKKPPSIQIQAAKDFLKCALDLGELDKDYKLFGARQVSATASPGIYIFNDMKNWPHFTTSP
nr:peptidoglycan-recognition protein 2-like [Leptinotarsa decemlineata]